MALRDSFDKIVMSYFACITAEPFTYKGEVYEPKPLRVSPQIFRDYKCPAMCGGCCVRFSLDYLPHETARPDPDVVTLRERVVEFNTHPYTLLSDMQVAETYYCSQLSQSDGRCNIHGTHPFSCDFELIRFMQFDVTRPNALTQKLYGRGWAMTRITGDKGALCTMEPVSDASRREVIRKLLRLQQWTDYFNLRTKLPVILDWAQHDHHAAPCYAY